MLVPCGSHGAGAGTGTCPGPPFKLGGSATGAGCDTATLAPHPWGCGGPMIDGPPITHHWDHAAQDWAWGRGWALDGPCASESESEVLLPSNREIEERQCQPPACRPPWQCTPSCPLSLGVEASPVPELPMDV